MSEDEIIGEIDEVIFEDWQIKLLNKLREWFPEKQREKKDEHK